MKYMLLIYNNENAPAPQMTPEQQKAEMEAWFTFGTDAEKAGVMVSNEGLAPTASATTVRVRDSKTLTTDGPFAETHEQLGGYYLLDCKDLDEAIGWAAKIPGAKYGSIEVRPVVTYTQE